MSSTTFLEVAGADGRPVRGVVHGAPDAPAVLVAHGFKGFKGWGWFPWIADQLAAAGLRAIRFDFSHNGVETSDFDRLDLFAIDTPTRHQEDLRAVSGAVRGPLGLLGHSRGGADVLLFAAGEPRVRCAATLAAVDHFATLDQAGEATIRETGYLPVPNARTKQLMPMSRLAFEDARCHDLEGAVRSLDQPLLLVHGTADESVPPAALERLAAWAPNAEALAVDGAGHTFGAAHPWQGPSAELETVLARVTAFFRAHLLEAS